MSTRAPDVVIVDHDLEALRTLVAPLRDEFEFYLTISPNDALTALERQPIRALVAGQTLFTGTGIEVLAQARRRFPRTARVLIANAVERRAVEAEIAAAELFHTLKRPCTPEQLKEVLHAAARSARMTPDGATGEHVVLESPEEHPHAVSGTSGEPITVLTTDVDLFESIRTAVHGRHDVNLASKLEDAARLAASGQCAVLVTDLALTEAALRRITGHLHARENSLVTIAVGNREQGNALMGLLSNGKIHRFLLKPVTPGLARLAIESASRQHASQKAHHRAETHFELRPMPAFAPVTSTATPQETFAPITRQRLPAGRIAGFAVAAIGVLGMAAGLWWHFSHQEPPPDPRLIAIQTNLSAAQAALRSGHLVDPAAGSALALFSEVLKLDPQNAAATTGIDQIATHFIERAETNLVEGDLDAASAALDSARSLRPDHRRLRFLDAQLAKELQDHLVLQARESVTAGNLQQAQDLLQQAEQVDPGASSEVAAAQVSIDSRERTRQVGAWLDLARQRVAQGRLVAPPNDSAKYYLRSAQRVEPDNVAVQQGLRDLGDRTIAAADAAIAAQRLDIARGWSAQAEDLAVEKSEIDALKGRIAAATDQKSKSDLLALVIKRTEENRLLEPAQDSARFHLGRLLQIDPAFPGIDGAVQGLGATLVMNAHGATAQKQFDAATRMLAEARAIGYSGADLASAEAALRSAQAPTGNAGKTPQEVAPKRTKYVAPEYPKEALSKGLEGWVDVSFSVTFSGDVADVRIEDARPRRQFDRAATSAVREWKFEPRADGAEYSQRLRTRVEFKLED